MTASPSAIREQNTNALRMTRVRQLNDHLRSSGKGGIFQMTNAVACLPPDDTFQILAAVAAFDNFTDDNDPYGEHDCAVQQVGEQTIIWKIDYYDRTRTFLSPDPSDPKQTVRVLTVMLASEY